MFRNFEEKRLTGAVFLDVANAPVWVDGLLYKLTTLNFPSHLVKTVFSYLKGRTFEASFQRTTSTTRRMQAGVAQGEIISPILFSLYVNDMPSLSCHVELALYADDTAVIATSRQLALLVKYLETYLSDLERMEYRHQCLEELRYALRQDRLALFETPSSTTIRGANPLGQ